MDVLLGIIVFIALLILAGIGAAIWHSLKTAIAYEDENDEA